MQEESRTNPSETDGMELEKGIADYRPPPADKRPHMPEPPPVRLTAVEDVRAIAPPGLEVLLDQFYIGLLLFERDEKANPGDVVYKAENVRLVFTIVEPPIERADMRPIGVEVPSLALIEHRVVEREIDYQRLRGLLAAQEALLLQDPAGNWVSVTESRGVR